MKTHIENWVYTTLIYLGLAGSYAHGTNSDWQNQVRDSALKACIETSMKEKEWRSPVEVSTLKCHSMDIQSLQGLESFTHIETLSIYNNQLTQVDVDLSKLTKLKTLNLARNRIQQLTLKDLPALQKLYLFDNGMAHLALSDLPHLSIIKVNNNILADFEYSSTPNLSKIYIFNNKLETINIYDLPALTYMDCRQNPMPDELYDEMDKQDHVTYLHDGNAEDWN